ncbi:hypothetical protein [Calothrix sp. UHCC 0171]|uniref:hypothetical protein n=1 Tax=Calothrix sp. UHCC 0171 TaxID=3110245 RepID=UPI002B204EB9|nr:hypothetical protein [Calothrix sp. UHCC 0171]MEA5574782.1 hypothetical protein [Calothrix sp. UHCC 0171]
MKTIILAKSIAIAVGISVIFPINPSYSQPAILTVNASQARGLNSRAIEIKVGNGRATAIDFSNINERITQVFLSDPSNFTYSTDTPLENGQSTTLFIRRIKPLRFPNLTTSSNTNLFVKTRNSDGQSHLYTFNLKKISSAPIYSGIAISNQTLNSTGIEPTIQVDSSRRASISDIERGLIAAIRRGYTSASDPVVAKIREFIALARNTSDKTLIEIAVQTKVSLPLITELGLLGIEENLKPPISFQGQLIPPGK